MANVYLVDGPGCQVDLSTPEVSEWAKAWPCFGPRCGLSFVFARNGDLVDLWSEEQYGGEPAQDGAGLSALADDVRLSVALGWRGGAS